MTNSYLSSDMLFLKRIDRIFLRHRKPLLTVFKMYFSAFLMKNECLSGAALHCTQAMLGLQLLAAG